jgi:hypothetical protein
MFLPLRSFPNDLDGRPRLSFVFLRFFRWLFPIVSSLRLSFCGLLVLISSTISTRLSKWFAEVRISAVEVGVVAACASKGAFLV